MIGWLAHARLGRAYIGCPFLVECTCLQPAQSLLLKLAGFLATAMFRRYHGTRRRDACRSREPKVIHCVWMSEFRPRIQNWKWQNRIRVFGWSRYLELESTKFQSVFDSTRARSFPIPTPDPLFCSVLYPNNTIGIASDFQIQSYFVLDPTQFHHLQYLYPNGSLVQFLLVKTSWVSSHRRVLLVRWNTTSRHM